ncbi:hypothetical protein GCM10009665_41710 [Kitasatospora nipponensis]|uniref:FXSXX-COOH protein n=1 Tax=Kitasatospora nipponensis TaxID=258049 RepID=A0ABP4H0M9_9ACTN
MTMSIITALESAVDDRRSGGLPAVADVQRPVRPRDLLRLPALAQSEPDDTDGPTDHREDGRRATGARCRIAMGYVD